MIPIIKTKIGKGVVPLCKNCKHSLTVSNKQVCALYKFKEEFIESRAARCDDNLCGENGKYFKAKN